MKIALLGLALILGGTAVVVRSSETFQEAPLRAPKAVVQEELVAVASTSPAAEAQTLYVPLPAPLKAVGASVPLPLLQDVPVAHMLIGALERSLKLTPLQMAQAEEIFRERDQRVDDYGREVARRGWTKLADFDLRVGELRDLSYRRLASILDVAQASMFALRVAAGIPEDSLSIEIPDGVVVLD